MKASELAKRAKVSVPFISLLESGDREPSLVVLRRLAKALDVPPETLFKVAMGDDEGSLTISESGEELATALNAVMEAEGRLKALLKETESHEGKGGGNSSKGRSRRNGTK